MSTTTLHPVAEQFAKLVAELNTRFLERTEEIHAIILALLSGHHIALIGAPGTAKTDLCRVVVHQITGKRYFEQQLSKTRPAEAVFGPLNIKEFRDNGNYLLKRTGFATDAEFVMFDEAFKMSPVLGHDMLALLNERLYHEVNGGNSVHEAPLHTAFLPSNELPTDEHEDAAALWDRVVIRKIVEDIMEDANFATLLTSAMEKPTTEIAWEDLKDVSHNIIPNIDVPASVVKALVGLRNGLRRESIQPSSRRFRQSRAILQANAFLNGRSEVIDADIEVLKFTLWETPAQIDKVERACLAASNPFHEPIMKIKDMVAELSAGMDEKMGADTAVKGEYAREVRRKLGMARDQFLTLQLEAGGPVPKQEETTKLLDGTLKRCFIDMFDLGEDEAEAGVQQLWYKED